MPSKNSLIFVFFLFLVSLFSAVLVVEAVTNNTLIAKTSTTTFTFVEGDLVKLKPSVSDLDQDKVFVYYFSPLNKSGEWQTTLNDAGTYKTKILVSDGRNEVEEKITLIVKNKNQPPKIKDTSLVNQEGDKIDLKKLISDPDKDDLKITYEKPFNQQGVWDTSYFDAGKYSTKVVVSDGEFLIKENINLVIKNKNAPPGITSFSPKTDVVVKEGQKINFKVDVKDVDNDKVNVLWQVDGINYSQEKSFEHVFNYSSAGKHKVLVKVSDGQDEIFKSWNVLVNNTNRAPVLRLPSLITVKEGEKITLKLPVVDLDGDKLKYTFSSPLEKGVWKAGYNDAGNYTVSVNFTDGKFVIGQTIILVVEDVDRAPTINFQEIKVNEGQRLVLNLNKLVADPDKDNLSITATNLPTGAKLNNGILEWIPSYNVVQRKVNFFTNFLNRIKLEKFIFAQSKKVSVPIVVCGKKVCSNKSLVLKVVNKNQKPLLSQMNNIVVGETKVVSLKPIANDADKDIVKYRFEQPFNSKGVWKTSFGDAGNYTVKVMASDGKTSDTKFVNVVVKNKNRRPTFKIKKDYFKINENQKFGMYVDATDPDGDKLNISVAELPRGASFKNQVFSWTPDYDIVSERKPGFLNNIYAKSDFLNRRFNDEYKQFGINFIASDGEFKVVHPVLLTVKNVNRPPKMNSYFPAISLSGLVGEEIVFRANVSDPDGDKLTYEWDFGVWDEGLVDGSEIGRTFVEPGVKLVRVKVGDGTYFTEQEWRVRISAPVVEKSIPLALAETKTEPVKKVEEIKPVVKESVQVEKKVVSEVKEEKVEVKKTEERVAVVKQVEQQAEQYDTYTQYVIDVPAESEVSQAVVSPELVQPVVEKVPETQNNYKQYVIDVPADNPIKVIAEPVVPVQVVTEPVVQGESQFASYIIEH